MRTQTQNGTNIIFALSDIFETLYVCKKKCFQCGISIQLKKFHRTEFDEVCELIDIQLNPCLIKTRMVCISTTDFFVSVGYCLF